MPTNVMNLLVRLYLSIVATNFVCEPSAAQPVDGVEAATLEDAYQLYKSAFAARDFAKALPAARQAYELGLERYGRIDANAAALAMNYGNMAAMSASDTELAVEMYTEADAIYAEVYGPDSLERIQAITALATVQAAYADVLASLRTAQRIHRVARPDDDTAYAELLVKNAELLRRRAARNPDAVDLLSEALEVFEGEFGKDSPALVPHLFAVGAAFDVVRGGERRQRQYFDRALDIIKSAEPENSEAIGDLELQIARHYFSESRGRTRAQSALPYAESAHARFVGLFGPEHPKSALAALTLGDALIETNEKRRGMQLIEHAIQYYDGKPEFAAALALARRALISVYLKEGDDERFTEQLMELGRLSERTMDTVEYLPIYKVAPQYPTRAAMRGLEGTVLVEFTVDEEGRVRDPVIVASRSSIVDQGALFHSAALEAARQFRYVPRFENGMPVSVAGVRNTITFQLER